MNPQNTRRRQRWWLAACSVPSILLGALMVWPTTALSSIRVEFSHAEIALSAAAPGIEGRVHRMITRTERLVERLSGVVASAAVAWLWILPSTILFLIFAAVTSAMDLRMLDLRQQTPQVSARDLGHGVRIFFRVLRDRRTPYLPRAVLVSALLYWLLPVDLVGDGRPVVGMLDDLLVAVLAAKLFIYLCPDMVVAAHAEAVRAEA